MAEIREYVWVFPIVAGVLAVVSLLAPALSNSYVGYITTNLWFWDLYTYNFVGLYTGTVFVPETMVIVPSIITTGIFATGGIVLLVSGMANKSERFELKTVRNLSVLFGVLFIISEILWLIMVTMYFPIETYFPNPDPLTFTITFWNLSTMGYSIPLHNVGFGIIGGFISGGLAFGSAGAAHYYSKERPVKIPEKKEVIPLTKEPSPPVKAEFDTCPECGAKIEDPSTKFCGKCGFELKGVPMTQIP